MSGLQHGVHAFVSVIQIRILKYKCFAYFNRNACKQRWRPRDIVAPFEEHVPWNRRFTLASMLADSILAPHSTEA